MLNEGKNMGEATGLDTLTSHPEWKQTVETFSQWLKHQDHAFPNIGLEIDHDSFFFNVRSGGTIPLSAVDRRLPIPTRSITLEHDSGDLRIVPSWLYAGIECADTVTTDWLEINGIGIVRRLIDSTNRYPSYGPSHIGGPSDVEHLMNEIADRIINPPNTPQHSTNFLEIEEALIRYGVDKIQSVLKTSPLTKEIQIVVGRLYPHLLAYGPNGQSYEELIIENKLPLTSLKDFSGEHHS